MSEETKKGPGRPKTVEKTPELTHNGVGLYQGSDKMWYVAILRFNPETGHATVTERVLAGEDKYFANETFKLKVVELEIV